MFSKSFSTFIVSAGLVLGAAATPLKVNPLTRDLAPRYVSFDNWGGISSLANFDDFYGVDDFSHSYFQQTIVTEQSQELVCHSESIEIIQQRLAIIQEIAKRIITEQICEVETQTIVFTQFHASLGTFSDDLRRISGYQVGYDRDIVSHYGDLFDADGSITTNDLGFSGLDVGSNTVVVSGSNWDSVRSVQSVNAALSAAQSASLSSSD